MSASTLQPPILALPSTSKSSKAAGLKQPTSTITTLQPPHLKRHTLAWKNWEKYVTKRFNNSTYDLDMCLECLEEEEFTGSPRWRPQLLTCSELCTWDFPKLRFLTKATTAKTKTIILTETLIEVKFIPIGDNPKNRPDSPTRLKLNATDNTVFSTKSSLFSAGNKTLTRQ